MPIAQRRLDFPVQKGMGRRTRSSAKFAPLDLTENVVVKSEKKSHRKRHSILIKDQNTSIQCSPPKMKKENQIPTENLALVRIPLSPRKDNNIQVSQSPLKSPFTDLTSYSSPLKTLLCSPKVARSLNFSPVRRTESPVRTTENVVRTESLVRTKSSPTKSPSFRRLNFSPTRSKSPMKSLTKSSPAKLTVRALNFDANEENKLPVKLSPRKSLTRVGTPRPVDVTVVPSPLRLMKQDGLCYHQVKQALHTALPDRIVCREDEYATVKDFLDKHTRDRTAGSLYISGAPGTGKTAVLSHTMQRLQNEKTKVVYINCMSFKNSLAIYNKILTELKGKETSATTKQALSDLGKATTGSGASIVLILDEMDQLDSKNQEVLYTMFEWPSLPKSRLVLIGIANALDLTDRILPRLQARPKCKPQLLHFSPYTKDQIVQVLQSRLAQLEVGGEKIIEPGAIQFCARKVAAVAGDMRKALDVCRRAVELVETDVRKQAILSAGLLRSPRKHNTALKKIGVAHILKIMNEVYGNRVGSSSQPQTIPLQQKLLICSLLLMLKRGKGKEVTLGKLHDCYSKVCQKQNVCSSAQAEFLSMCGLIEARGILNMKKAKETRSAKISLKLDEKELEFALQDKTLMSSVLRNGLA